jgi:hypothetical protein
MLTHQPAFAQEKLADQKKVEEFKQLFKNAVNGTFTPLDTQNVESLSPEDKLNFATNLYKILKEKQINNRTQEYNGAVVPAYFACTQGRRDNNVARLYTPSINDSHCETPEKILGGSISSDLIKYIDGIVINKENQCNANPGSCNNLYNPAAQNLQKK